MLELITGPQIEPITYADVLSHLRIDPFDEAIDLDSITYVDRLITSVRRAAEVFTHRAFITQTWKQYFQDWPSTDYIELSKPPLQSITSATVLQNDTVVVTLDTTEYLIDTVSLKGRLILAYEESWPSVDLYPMNPIQIEFVCGYGDTPEDVPADIRHAILLQVGDLWDQREDFREGKLYRPSEMLLWPYRVFW